MTISWLEKGAVNMIATIQNVLITALLAAWLCISIVILVSVVQSVRNDHKREKREQAKDARDLEYHQERMKALK
jgi:uncharacterized membrane protein